MGKIVYVDVSARHIHIRSEDVETLFGPGVDITPRGGENHMGPGMIVYEQRLEIIGPKSSIKNVSILGPLRKYVQVEVSMTDARKLGVTPSIRDSGHQEGSPGCRLVGPYGTLDIDKGVIVAQRHIHISEAEAEEMGIKENDMVWAKVEGTGRSLVFGDVRVHTHPKVKTTIHIDTDEANAAGMSGLMQAEIMKDLG